METLDKFLESESEKVKELRSQIAEKDRIMDAYQKEHGRLEIFFSSILASVSAISPSPVVYVPSEQTDKTEIEGVVHITDMHMGAVQEASEIEGFNEYSPEICEARCMDFVRRFNRYTDRKRLSYTVNNCSVLVTGDLISGDIHHELSVTNAFPVTVQVVRAAQVLAAQLATLAQNFMRVTVHFISADNHSRLTKKPQAKQEGINSLNYLVGVLAQAYVKDHTNVEFNIYPQHEKVITVLNRNYLISHGHAMKAWLGIPYYAADRKLGKEFTARMQLIMDHKLKAAEIGFHKMITGHFHTPINTPQYQFGGSVQGTDAYDHKDGRFAVPSQACWFVHPKYKEMSREDFEL
jgi:hypothetical protein